jgi:hypothetical protein
MTNITESLTASAQGKEQVLYSVLYVIAAAALVAMGAPGYVAFLLIFGTVLYNVSKIGKNKYWFEENSTTDWIIGISYLVSVGAGVIVGILYTFGIV